MIPNNPMTREFLQARITSIEARIIIYEDALIALGPNSGIKAYKIDTGQSSQSVTRNDIKMIEDTIASLMNSLATYCARLNGSGTIISGPGW